ncbi:hypothetical protein AtubIFM55763_009965 [Aspergillus tubingensis]|uniref:Uncharacterized protein n=1 Tax=Aspergillus tubingensis TaxID=5068 RepID=A0A8H3SQD9_ASPTU|nr:putative methyltransferase family protein [Aspergillus tubingensis]GFN13937.1 putative methyltransferase family protein [Aspergillus tubingensis]GLA77774.1 hypothetical protein AtubIFM55763_009965 [Aspergillus tubingensis]GLA80853.1 hypothetical protein AtubIFM56815_004485 [Aspergillus tubingensis]GLB23423.1 hypothetical protein AtubIFM61612_004018 [Aspergillus tubingensis]
MSPAPIAAEMQQDQRLETLARAFEALLLTTQQLSCREKSLQQRLKYASDEYLKLAGKLPGGVDGHTKVVADKMLGRYAEYDHNPKPNIKPPDVVKALAESGNVGDLALTAITEGLTCYQSIIPPHESRQLSEFDSCLVATRAGVPAPLEKDFTTKGTQGSLRCPFAKHNNKTSENGVSNGTHSPLKDQNGDACGHADLDPIKAEQSDRRSSRAPSTRSSATRCPVSRCPIRYLDQHSPEEIADYVERHKHEIPRSHAICVQRYQRDGQTMRQLDAKYGSLINMIQGLSAKHKAFLPEPSQNGTAPSSSSAERVEKWAQEVDMKSDMHPPIKEEQEEEAAAEQEDEERKGHFDRPLREIRVGESPSRPWGIPVPVSPLPPTASPPQSPPPAPVATSIDAVTSKVPNAAPAGLSSMPPPGNTAPAPPANAPKKGGCPFGHGAPSGDKPPAKMETIPTPAKVDKADEPAEKKNGELPGEPPSPSNKPAANIVFNGPVFFGFSAEQTAAFMQQLSNLGAKGLA